MLTWKPTRWRVRSATTRISQLMEGGCSALYSSGLEVSMRSRYLPVCVCGVGGGAMSAALHLTFTTSSQAACSLHSGAGCAASMCPLPRAGRCCRPKRNPGHSLVPGAAAVSKAALGTPSRRALLPSQTQPWAPPPRVAPTCAPPPRTGAGSRPHPARPPTAPRTGPAWMRPGQRGRAPAGGGDKSALQSTASQGTPNRARGSGPSHSSRLSPESAQVQSALPSHAHPAASLPHACPPPDP